MTDATSTSGPTVSAARVAGTNVDRRAIAGRVRRDHATIRTLLDDVERGCAAAQEGRAGAVDRLRGAVWDLYLVFVDHLAMEEAHVAPILRAHGARGEERTVQMFLEHNEQRLAILELVEDAERDAKQPGELIAEATALVVALRKDMDLEERSLALVLDDDVAKAG